MLTYGKLVCDGMSQVKGSGFRFICGSTCAFSTVADRVGKTYHSNPKQFRHLPLFLGRLRRNVHLEASRAMSPINTNANKITDYAKYLNEVGRRRQPSVLRELTKIWSALEPGTDTVFFAAGNPNPTLFPFESVQFEMTGGTKIKLEGTQLKAGLQYLPTNGYPPLLESLRELMYRYHAPPNWEDTEIIVTVGSQHGLCAMVELLVEPGDKLIVPTPVYSSALTTMDPHQPEYLGIPTDSKGMIPAELQAILEKASKTGKKPKLMYINPTGSNPDGTNTSLERRKEIYKIAQSFDLLILEDDPYYFLHFEKENPVSFLSLDVDGRVVRFDSFSKVLSSGIRVGFATGPKDLLRKLELSIQATCLHAASLSQVVVDGILREWKADGLEAHLKKVQDFYRDRRDKILEAAKEHLTGLAEWHVPMGGMFLWIKVLGIKDSFKMVMERGKDRGILLLPGGLCFGNREIKSPYVRASFSVVPIEDMDKGMKRLAALIREEQKLQQ